MEAKRAIILINSSYLFRSFPFVAENKSVKDEEKSKYKSDKCEVQGIRKIKNNNIVITL